jgi:hypothetical protein
VGAPGDQRTHDSYNVPSAAGLVAGESIVKAFIAMAATAFAPGAPTVFRGLVHAFEWRLAAT